KNRDNNQNRDSIFITTIPCSNPVYLFLHAKILFFSIFFETITKPLRKKFIKPILFSILPDT
ncbi:hypothetical protein DRQ07_05470, partial [candidate division KSB1 bacterium]